MAQLLEQLTCIQEVTGSNPGSEQIFFFRKSILFAYTLFLKFSFDNTSLAFQARIETRLEQNWMHVIWELDYGDC